MRGRVHAPLINVIFIHSRENEEGPREPEAQEREPDEREPREDGDTGSSSSVLFYVHTERPYGGPGRLARLSHSS